MLVEIIMRKRIPNIQGKGSREKRVPIELTGNRRSVCHNRKCFIQVEASFPTKVKFSKSHSYLFLGMFRRITQIEGWQDTSITKYIPIESIEIKTTHDEYVEMILENNDG